MMDLSELLIKLMQLGIMVIGILIIFFMFISYNVNIYNEDTERQAYVLGDHLLSSRCLTEMDSNNNVIKSLFVETKVSNVQANPTQCINYEKGKVEIDILNCVTPPCSWSFDLKPSATYENKNAQFIVAIKRADGSIVPANMTVIL
jgi:hypothetical protein